MNRIDSPLALLGGLTPAAFMKRHWQKKPLLVRQAMPGIAPPLPRPALFDLAARDDVESRLVQHDGERWRLRHGPFRRRAVPALAQPGWTLLVQGLELHVPAAHRLRSQFSFIPGARLDDVMVSYASDGGGVGPHFDSYDVFLLQVEGRREWRIGRLRKAELRDDVPLKVLRHFEPEQRFVLDPGDMLYLPPRWAHDGIAVGGDCMTCSIGFRAPRRSEAARELLLRLADADDGDDAPLYRDPQQPATAMPAALPEDLLTFAAEALRRRLDEPGAIERAAGEWLSEPKPQIVFEPTPTGAIEAGLRVAPGTRLFYDARHLFINGESYRMGGRDARLLRGLADSGTLAKAGVAALSAPARELVAQWFDDGWLLGPAVQETPDDHA